MSTGAWPKEVGVQLAVWNNVNGINSVGLLATATGSGLCRIDNVSGRWMRDHITYGGVGGIRLDEGVDPMDVDTEESEAD